MSTDRIEKQVRLRAPVSRVWRAITDSREFGSWFGMKLEGPFVAGKPIFGTISPTTVDATVAASQKPFEGTNVELVVDTIEPETRFAFRWCPFALEKDVDYSKETKTLVTFT